MKKSMLLLLTVLVTSFLFSSLSNKCFAKGKDKEQDLASPDCTVIGEISCPKGFKPDCPKQYKPKCIFVGGKQYPACLADSADSTFFNYRLDKITCKK